MGAREALFQNDFPDLRKCLPDKVHLLSGMNRAYAASH
jgi:hypothetical protein